MISALFPILIAGQLFKEPLLNHGPEQIRSIVQLKPIQKELSQGSWEVRLYAAPGLDSIYVIKCVPNQGKYISFIYSPGDKSARKISNVEGEAKDLAFRFGKPIFQFVCAIQVYVSK